MTEIIKKEPGDVFSDRSQKEIRSGTNPGKQSKNPISTMFMKMNRNRSWIFEALLLLVILFCGAYFRLTGLDWDDNHHLHPDERFLTMVASSVSIPHDLGDYFDTTQSPLNPGNRGYGFYVYGTFPLFLVRLIGEMTGMTGYSEIYLVGRFLSAIFDLLIILLVYLISYRLYHYSILSLLACAFSSMSVMLIQLSHYFTVDNFANFFSCLGIYAALVIMTERKTGGQAEESDNNYEFLEKNELEIAERLETHPEIDGNDMQESQNLHKNQKLSYWPYILFGIAMGLALASKVSTLPVIFLLPLASVIFLYRQPKKIRMNLETPMLMRMGLSLVLAFLVFRIFQPYAFAGPGFFNLIPDQRWLSSLAELSAQSSGNADFPPALQWARRPLSFAFENIIRWGLGLPLGILAWAGFIWMGIRILQGEWKNHLLLWGWTAVYFTWQSLNFSRSMRYQIPIYPMLSIMAAWALVALWNRKRKNTLSDNPALENRMMTKWSWNRILALSIGIFVLISTFAWAFSFSRIYNRPVTRVAASEWIYQNIPSAVNIHVSTDDGFKSQPLSYPLGMSMKAEEPINMAFTPQGNGYASDIQFTYIVDRDAASDEKTITAEIRDDIHFDSVVAFGQLQDTFTPASGDIRGKSYTLSLNSMTELEEGKHYHLVLKSSSRDCEIKFTGPMILHLASDEDGFDVILPEPVKTIEKGGSIALGFNSLYEGEVQEIYLPHILDWQGEDEEKTLLFSLRGDDEKNAQEMRGEIAGAFLAGEDLRGDGYTVKLEKPFRVEKDGRYTLTIRQTDGNGMLAFYGSRQANESTWDDALPIDLYGLNPFDVNDGIYRSELNFEMYWDDNDAKRQRFIDTLEQADYIFISSSRQWGSTVRVPERYPMTTMFYQELMGCPPDKDVLSCYTDATVGDYQSNLGFELVKVFKSEPNLGRFEINTQSAEEAFSVYDHPKVFIFKKTAEYDSVATRNLFKSIDLSKVVHLTPGQVKSYPADLMLPRADWFKQQISGTWSKLFDRESFVNQPFWAVVIWYLALTLLGWMCYPLVRLVFGSLADKGYPLSRLVGLILLAYLSWMAGSMHLGFTRGVIWGVMGVILLVNIPLFMMQKDSIFAELKSRRNYFLLVEVVALSFFLLFLLIRLGNPDLWHPYKGGEKPMDFSYLNAVIKSVSFPPYNPWFAGGYINYYYYGFVITGVLVKALGIVPSLAYNLILPALFSMFALGAFCIGWNLMGGEKKDRHAYAELKNDVLEEPEQAIKLQESIPSEESLWGVNKRCIYAGLAASIGSLLLGNLGTVRMIGQGFQKLAAPSGNIQGAALWQQLLWSLQGVGNFIKGSPFAYYPGDWYWIPSRVYQENAITEFPMFSFLYADLHAHLIALPLTLLAIAWVINLISKSDKKQERPVLTFLLTFILGGLIIGALKPTNTWDFPTYLTLGCLVSFYHFGLMDKTQAGFFSKVSPLIRQLIKGFGSVILLLILSFVLYTPFSAWYAQGYNSVSLWNGEHADIPSYLVHWGVFLFIIVSWMIWETIDWMKRTPLSSIKKPSAMKTVLQIAPGLLILALVGCLIRGVVIGLIALPLMLWAGILLFKPSISDQKRFVLFLVGTAMFLTLLVEFVVLQGDVGRMNTVFKFYLQAWCMLSLSAAVALVWMLPVVSPVRSVLSALWTFILLALITGAALFPVMASVDKIRDRMAKDTPLTLDGMTYMAHALYNDANVANLDLRYDYEAIRWMQENVEGSPVIIEANAPEYRWGNRFTIYTGLPGVVGWNWHQRQQRGVASSDGVYPRIDDVMEFYQTVDKEQTEDILKRYNIQYIVFGQYEKAYYPGAGMDKFDAWNGVLWNKVYANDETTIYEVIGK